MMLHISTLQIQVVKCRQLFKHSIHAHFTNHVYTAWAENIANAWLPYTNIIGNTLRGIPPI